MLEVLPLLAMLGVQVDAVVTDPPYHLTSIVKRFGADNAAPAQVGATGAYARASSGFVGKKWDGGDIAFRPETWRLVYDVMKPGAHLVAFGGTRTYHRLACAIEDAGFETRDTVSWLYGTGFPKSHNQQGEWRGWGTALKPACELIVLARKPLIGTVAANLLGHGTGALNIDGCRIGTTKGVPASVSRGTGGSSLPGSIDHSLRREDGTGSGHDPNVVRWPANVIHDGSEEVLAAFPDTPGQQGKASSNPDSPRTRRVYGAMGRADDPTAPRGDSGSAARFFYCAKATKADRIGSKHPTVKPIALIRYLCRLVTPPGGTILDPFAGSGTLAAAAHAEGFNAILVEREAEYITDIQRRIRDVE